MILLDQFIDVLRRAPAPVRRRLIEAYGRALRAWTRPPAATGFVKEPTEVRGAYR